MMCSQSRQLAVPCRFSRGKRNGPFQIWCRTGTVKTFFGSGPERPFCGMGDCERERNGTVIWLIENGTIPVQNGPGRACTAGKTPFGPLQSKLKCNRPNAANGYFAAFCLLHLYVTGTMSFMTKGSGMHITGSGQTLVPILIYSKPWDSKDH